MKTWADEVSARPVSAPALPADSAASAASAVATD